MTWRPRITTLCDGCPNGDFCREHGCVAWNEHARRLYGDHKVRTAKERERLERIDRLMGRDRPWG